MNAARATKPHHRGLKPRSMFFGAQAPVSCALSMISIGAAIGRSGSNTISLVLRVVMRPLIWKIAAQFALDDWGGDFTQCPFQSARSPYGCRYFGP